MWTARCAWKGWDDFFTFLLSFPTVPSSAVGHSYVSGSLSKINNAAVLLSLCYRVPLSPSLQYQTCFTPLSPFLLFTSLDTGHPYGGASLDAFSCWRCRRLLRSRFNSWSCTCRCRWRCGSTWSRCVVPNKSLSISFSSLFPLYILSYLFLSFSWHFYALQSHWRCIIKCDPSCSWKLLTSTRSIESVEHCDARGLRLHVIEACVCRDSHALGIVHN